MHEKDITFFSGFDIRHFCGKPNYGGLFTSALLENFTYDRVLRLLCIIWTNDRPVLHGADHYSSINPSRLECL